MEKQANAVERASQALQTSSNAQQRSEAERVLISLCKSPKPYSLCLYILTKSQQPLAQFQALKAIYEAMLREWGEIGGAQRQQLREILLQFATSRKLEAFVANKLAQVAAVLFKREWLEKEKPLIAAVELRIMKLASAPNNILALSLATVFAKALLAEFSCDQSSSLGLPCSFHVRCHRSFEKSVLLPVFTLMVRILSTQTKALSSHADTSNQPILRERIHIISSCLAVMHSVLSWEFEESASNEALVMRLQANSDSSPASSSSFVRPGPKWKTILLDSNLLPTLLQIYPVLRRFMKGLRGRHGFGGFDVLRNLRQTFLQLMSLRGSIFSDQSTAPPTSPPSRQQLNGFGINPRTKLGYLSQLVKACSSLTQCAGCGGSVDSVDEDEISELCDMYQRLCKTFGVMWIFRLSFLESSSLMQNLTRLTCWLCSGYFGSLLDDTVSTWASEAFDVLCHTWVTLISQLVEDEHSLVKGKQGAPPVSPEVIKGALQLVTKCSGEVFPQYLERRLFLARKEATEALQASRQGAEFKEQHEQFSDSSYLDDELECLGLVARLNARVNLGHLVQVTKARVQSLRKFAELELQGGRGGGASPNSNVVHCSVSHEELIWLVRLLGYMLADTEEGETPLIPNTIMQLARQGPDSSKLSGMDLIVQAVESVLLLAELENKLLEFSVKNNRGSKSESLSPLVATHVVQFLRRWSASYLMPFESYYSLIAPGIWQSFGQGTPTSVRILHAIVQKLCSNLAYWSEEEDLVEATSLLLKTLVKSEKVRRSLPLTPAWNGVVAAYQKSVLITHLQTKQPATFIKGPIMESMVHTMGQCSVFSSQAATPSSNQIKFSQVVQPINRRLQFFLQSVSNPENEKVRLSIRFRKELVEILHMLRGVASLRGAQAYPEAFAFLSGALKHLIELLSLYHPFHGVVTLTLQLFQDIAESGELMYLDPPLAKQFMQRVLALVGQYSKVIDLRLRRLRATSTSQSHTGLDDETMDVESSLADIETLLSILSFIVNPDESPDGESAALAAEAALLGLSSLTPFLAVPIPSSFSSSSTGSHASSPKKDSSSCTLLEFPDLCGCYYKLLKSCVVKHPERFSKIPVGVQKQTLQSIHFAMQHSDASIARSGLEALASLTLYFIKSQLQSGGDQSFFAPFRKSLVQFLQVLLRRALQSSIAPEIVDPLADALFPITILAKEAFLQTAMRFIQLQFFPPNQTNLSPAQKVKLQHIKAAFQKLIEGNQLQQVLQASASNPFGRLTSISQRRLVLRCFRQNFSTFLVEMRNFTVIK